MCRLVDEFGLTGSPDVAVFSGKTIIKRIHGPVFAAVAGIYILS
jgi:hypothetical protein